MVELSVGQSAAGAGGGMSLSAGDTAGAGVSGGSATLSAGAAALAAKFQLAAGSGNAGDGGTVALSAGTASGSGGVGGDVSLTGGAGPRRGRHGAECWRGLNGPRGQAWTSRAAGARAPRADQSRSRQGTGVVVVIFAWASGAALGSGPSGAVMIETGGAANGASGDVTVAVGSARRRKQARFTSALALAQGLHRAVAPCRFQAALAARGACLNSLPALERLVRVVLCSSAAEGAQRP